MVHCILPGRNWQPIWNGQRTEPHRNSWCNKISHHFSFFEIHLDLWLSHRYTQIHSVCVYSNRQLIVVGRHSLLLFRHPPPILLFSSFISPIFPFPAVPQFFFSIVISPPFFFFFFAVSFFYCFFGTAATTNRSLTLVPEN